jgi:ABC-type sulfate/molybdate transport systems ATPase subunit
VPQDDLLFPHLDVRANLLFGVRHRTEALTHRLDSLAHDLGIRHLFGRRINAISGGEAQRVALGRALLLDLDVLLLDECTSALDAETRAIVGAFLAGQRRRRHLSVVQVTHDSAEARRLADVIVTMDNGRLIRTQAVSMAAGSHGGRAETPSAERAAPHSKETVALPVAPDRVVVVAPNNVVALAASGTAALVQNGDAAVAQNGHATVVQNGHAAVAQNGHATVVPERLRCAGLNRNMNSV